MKKKLFTIILSFIICITPILSSCTYGQSDEQASKQTDSEIKNQSKDEIKELESQILTLLQNQQISETERQKEISALRAEIDALKKPLKETASESESESESKAPSIFKYTLNGYKATITAINTDAESIVIPSVLDGHAVIAVGSNVLQSKSTKRIVISSGIESLDWFAFKDCSALVLVSIPETVTSIGYGAFDGAQKRLTIECAKNSFAMKYAQSYGLKYDAK